MKKELNTKARMAAFGGGSASDTPKADSRAPMAPPYLQGGSRNRSGFEYRTRNLRKIHHLLTDSKGRLIEVPLRRGKANFPLL